MQFRQILMLQILQLPHQLQVFIHLLIILDEGLFEVHHVLKGWLTHPKHIDFSQVCIVDRLEVFDLAEKFLIFL